MKIKKFDKLKKDDIVETTAGFLVKLKTKNDGFFGAEVLSKHDGFEIGDRILVYPNDIKSLVL